MSLEHSADFAGPGWDAAAYDRVADPQTRWGIAVLERLPLVGSETVLDAGCGTGRVTQELLRRLPHGRAVGVDASAAMLDEARRRLGSDRRLHLVHRDLLDLTLADAGGEPVDAVFSTATFHWVLDHSRLFGRLAAVLRPGGRLVAQCGAEGNVARLTEVVRSLGVERPGRWLYASASETRDRLAGAGFTDIEVWTHDEPTEFADARSLHDFLEAVCLREAVATLAPAERERFLDAVVTRMPDPVIDYVRLDIAATRA